MATIKDLNTIPHGGWRYIQPETGARFEGESLRELAAKVSAHRAYKGLPADDVALDIQRQLCVMLSDGQCAAEEGEDYRPVKDLSASLTLSMAVSLGKFLVNHFSNGGELVPKEEAERRAAICRTCPLNKPARLCPCFAAYKAIEFCVPPDRKPEGISVCMACGCSLQAKVNAPIEVIHASLPEDIVLPSWCWQARPATP
jgi:hypothetical protein